MLVEANKALRRKVPILTQCRSLYYTNSAYLHATLAVILIYIGFNINSCPESFLSQYEESDAQIPFRLEWEAGGQSIQYGRLPPQSEGFFQPLSGNSTLQIGYL